MHIHHNQKCLGKFRNLYYQHAELFQKGRSEQTTAFSLNIWFVLMLSICSGLQDNLRLRGSGGGGVSGLPLPRTNLNLLNSHRLPKIGR